MSTSMETLGRAAGQGRGCGVCVCGGKVGCVVLGKVGSVCGGQ